MPALNERLIFYFENKFYKIHKIKSASILSYLNIHQKKKKKSYILHILPSNFRTKHFFIKRIIYDLFEIVLLSRHRGRIEGGKRTRMRNGERDARSNWCVCSLCRGYRRN